MATTMDDAVVAQLNNAHARAIAASAGVDAQNAQLMQQNGANMAIAAHFDMRLLNGFLASQLFDLGLVESKAAYHTPVEPGAAPLSTPPSK